MKSQLTITQVNTLENQRKKTTETPYKFQMQELKKEKEKKKKRLVHHIADLTSKFYEKHNPCLLKIVIVILWRTINTKPK